MFGVTVSGIASGLEVTGYGTVSWNVYSQTGDVITISIDKVLHILSILTRLISPEQIYQQYEKITCFSLDSSSAKLIFQYYTINIPYDFASNLAITYAESNINNYLKVCNMNKVEVDNLLTA